MIDHTSISVPDLDGVSEFYDAVMNVLGHARVSESKGHIGYGVRTTEEGGEGSYISIVQSSQTFVPDNRHWAFRAPSRAAVEAFHRTAISYGGKCDGPPGPRPHYHLGYFAAFVLDPAGNRLEAVCHVR